MISKYIINNRWNATIDEIGSKAYSLFCLQKITKRVPQWVTISSKLYVEIISNVIPNNSKHINNHTILEIKKAIKEYIFPETFLDSIKGNFNIDILKRNSFAVRSSGSLEDLEEYSFAGQYQTYLDVKLEDLLTAIKKCWLSAWDENVISYFNQLNKNPLDNKLSVIIQEYIKPDFAGVLFTKAPFDSTKMLLEFVKGRGEKLVSGTMTPEILYLPRRNMILKKNIEIDLPKGFEKKIIKDFIKFSIKILQHKKTPQDIEWLIHEKRLYFVQSRPITTKFIEKEKETIWTSWFFDQRYNNPVSILNQDIIGKLIIKAAFKDPLKFIGSDIYELSDTVKIDNGRMYINLEIFKILFKFIPNRLLSSDFKNIFPGSYCRNERRSKLPLINIALLRGLLLLLLDGNWFVYFHKKKWNNYLKNKFENFPIISSTELQQSSLHELIYRLELELKTTSEFLSLHRWSIVWADFLYNMYIKMVDTFYPIKKTVIINSFHKNLNTITKTINTELEELIQNISKNTDNTVTKDHFNQFLTKYGHRTYSLDIAEKRWIDDFPEFYKRIVIPQINSRKKNKQSHKENNEPVRVFIPFTRLVRRFIEIREEQRFNWEKNLYNVRRICIELGKRAGIKEERNTFYLKLSELKLLLSNIENNKTKIFNMLIERKREYSNFSDMYPRFIGKISDIKRGKKNNNSLTGLGISHGKVKGKVRVIKSIQQLNELESDEIIVTRSTDPSWTVIFNRISGLIMERGGLLSHGAILAREYGIPAIVQVNDATQKLRTGMQILIDGENGIIKIL